MLTVDERARSIAEAVALLEIGLSHPPTMFYTRTDQLAKATRTVLAALTTAINQLDEARAVALEEAARVADDVALKHNERLIGPERLSDEIRIRLAHERNLALTLGYSIRALITTTLSNVPSEGES